MTPESWRGAINVIVYSLQFTVDLDDACAGVTADAIIGYRTFAQGPQVFLEAIRDALATDAVIMTELWDDPPYGREDLRHSEQDMRNFLAMTADHLQRRQPWPPMPVHIG